MDSADVQRRSSYAFVAICPLNRISERHCSNENILIINILALEPDVVAISTNPTWRIRDFGGAKSLINIEPTAKGLHYTRVAEWA